MGSLHTGSDDLIYIETELFSLTIKGPDSHPDLPGVSFSDKESSVVISSIEDLSFVEVLGEQELSDSFSIGESSILKYKTKPLFFEQQRYELVIEPSGEHNVEFFHDNPYIRDSISQTGRSKKLLTGIINFGNDIGYSDLFIKVDGIIVLKLTIEVFPTKIDYKTDYEQIIDDITKEIYNLIFDCFKKTYQSFGISSIKKSSYVEFFAIINTLYERFIASADIVLRNPHHVLVKDHEVLPWYKTRQTDNITIKWMEKHPDKVRLNSIGQISCEKTMAVKKHVTYDTKENRLTKYMLLQTVKRLEMFKHLYLQMSRKSDEERINRINKMCAGIRQRCNAGFMKAVAEAPGDSGMSLVFNMAPGYRNLYKIYLLLQRGLSITGFLYNSSEKDIAVLYEYWCFIKLNSILREKYELESQDVIQIRNDGLSVGLIQGKGSHIEYVNTNSGEKITLAYNHSFDRLPTVNQKPDNVLSLKKNGSGTSYEYVFDAKYRINPSGIDSEYYKAGYHTPGPEIDTINTMHRYRDAIVSRNGASPFERLMFGAYVLFPYKNRDEYKEHPFFKSIDAVNIGGLPFLPEETALVEAQLDKLIAETPENVYRRTILPNGIDDFYQRIN
ncbi:hypothetical protein B0O40_0369 [Ruminococcaceae bacterium R-25]|nr:hypothetical protein B0O40_0369 [Ruminococcaceae bacterium R-25]SUQ11006.1 hypothetical protein SAMN06297423_0369 [Oscillospiraceae bacterium]